MAHGREPGNRILMAAVLLVMATTWSASYLMAEKPAKSYPEEGKIVATGFNQIAVKGSTRRNRTYTVATQGKQYVLECNKRFFGFTGPECGGDKKLQIGDAIHFRIEKDYAFIPVTETDEGGKAKDGEQKLRILSEELKPDAK